jgi:hypothetical protein
METNALSPPRRLPEREIVGQSKFREIGLFSGKTRFKHAMRGASEWAP